MKWLFSILALLCGCTNPEEAEMKDKIPSSYEIASGTTVYCWYVEYKPTGLQGYSYHDGSTGDIPPLVGTPFSDLKTLAQHIKHHGATNIVLAPFYPSSVSSEWKTRPLTVLEQQQLGRWIDINGVEER
jgi:hypothetical protein